MGIIFEFARNPRNSSQEMITGNAEPEIYSDF